MRARCDAAVGRHEQSRVTPRRVLDERVPALLPSTLVDALLQETVLAVHAGDRFAAHKAPHAAIERAEPLDLFRPFVHAGPVVQGCSRSGTEAARPPTRSGAGAGDGAAMR